MSADTWVTIFILWGAIPATLFVVLYPFLSPDWRRTWIGWALLVSSSALALLLDLSLASKIFGTNYLARDVFRVGITAFIAAGATLKLVALLVAKFGPIPRIARRLHETGEPRVDQPPRS